MRVRATGHSEATTTDGRGIPSIRALREGRLRHPSVFANQERVEDDVRAYRENTSHHFRQQQGDAAGRDCVAILS